MSSALCALAAVGQESFAADPDLTGSYAIDAAKCDDVQSAINAGTAGMNFLIRDIARSRTAQTNPLYDRITIAHTADAVSVRFDERPPIEVPLDGRTISWTREDGGHFDVTAQWSAKKLIMRFVDADGRRTNTFVLDPSGALMSLNVELISAYLSAPIKYTLVYDRRDASRR